MTRTRRTLSGGRRGRRVTAAAAMLLSALGCTKGQLQGSSSAYLVIEEIAAAPGIAPSEFLGALSSDVITYVKKTSGSDQICAPTIFQDTGRVTLRLALKDPGSASAPTTPSSANTITLSRYHVEYLRADGRKVPGVDVPYGFDAALSVSITAGGGSGTFTLVRLQAKQEAPLKALAGGGGRLVISTIAEVTFYGTDAAGRGVSATAYIGVDFSDWTDPDC
jgi:hypothetical protein